jgi:hypothetical protein
MLATSTNNVTALAKVDNSTQVTGGLAIRNIDDLSRLSGMLAASGYFADAKEAAQCGVKVLAGLEMGIGAIQSMTGIHIIKGKPSVGSGLISAKVKASGKYDYEVLQHDDEVCILVFYESEFKPDVRNLKRQVLRGEINEQDYQKRLKAIALGISSFNLDDARKAGTQNIGKFTRNMLFARAISNGQKWYCPDVFSCSVYTPEELGVTVDDEGNMINYPDSQKISQAYTPQVATLAPNQLDPQRKELSDKILQIMRDKELDKEFVVGQMRTRYAGKTTRDQLTTEELQDFVQMLSSYQPPIDDEDEIPFN